MHSWKGLQTEHKNGHTASDQRSVWPSILSVANARCFRGNEQNREIYGVIHSELLAVRGLGTPRTWGSIPGCLGYSHWWTYAPETSLILFWTQLYLWSSRLPSGSLPIMWFFSGWGYKRKGSCRKRTYLSANVLSPPSLLSAGKLSVVTKCSLLLWSCFGIFFLLRKLALRKGTWTDLALGLYLNSLAGGVANFSWMNSWRFYHMT